MNVELFSVLGVLVKSYSHGVDCVIRLAQLLKYQDHLVNLIAEGINHLVTHYNCKGLVRSFVKQVTEWQTDEKLQDSQVILSIVILLYGIL